MTITRALLLRWLLAGFAIFATGMLGFELPRFGGTTTLPLLPGGIAVALTYRWGRAMWPAVLAGSLAIDLTLGHSVVGSIAVAVGFTLGSQFFAVLLARRGFDPDFGRASDVPLFVGAALASMAVPAVLALAGDILDGTAARESAAESAVGALRWFGNTSAGVLVVGPILIGLSRHSLARLADDIGGAAAWCAAVLACAAGVLLASDPIYRAPALIVMIVVIVTGSFRFGLVAAALAAFALTTATCYAIAFNTGIFTQVTQLQGRVLIWSVASALCGINLIVNALLAERDKAGRDKARAEQRYATIFASNPQPLWVHDPLTREVLLVNDAAVVQYGYAREEFLGRSVDCLSPPGALLPVLPGPEERASGDPFETRHVTRDGRVLEVEVSVCAMDFAGAPAELVFAADVTERRALGRALIDAIGNEQRRIGQEMHDGLGQELTGLSLSAKALATNARRERLTVTSGLEQLADLANVCIQSARDIVRGLSPLIDSDDNLEGALAALATRSSRGGTEVTVRTQLDCALDVDLDTRVHLFRIAQEALQNALKHAGATRVAIEFTVKRSGVRLSVTDNGSGFAHATQSGTGLGMRTMRFRASAIGGRVRITDRSGGGTAVVCEVPRRLPLAANG